MTKLEDIVLESGDKITYKNGDINYVHLSEKTYLEDTVYDLKKDRIVKIERFIQMKDTNKDNTKYYFIKTIWEKEEETPKKIAKFGTYPEVGNENQNLINHKVRDKLNELIDKINDLSKVDK